MQYKNFRDFDAFAATVRDVDCNMMIQNPKYNIWSICQTKLAGIDVQLGRLGSGNIVEGQSWSNGFVLYLPLTDRCKYSANGTVLAKNSFMIMEPGADICISTGDEHDWCSIFIPTHQLAATELLEPSSGSEQMKGRVRVSRPNPQLAEQFRAFVSQIMSAAANCSQIESGPAAKVAVAEALKISSLVVGQRQGGKPKPEGRPKLPREEIISRSKALIEEREGKIILIEELAAAAGVSERTLRTTFNEYFGVGPICYLQLRQLHQVKRALRLATPEVVSVTDVLLKYGVWEFGRFASRYRRLFGELPSETLRRKKR